MHALPVICVYDHHANTAQRYTTKESKNALTSLPYYTKKNGMKEGISAGLRFSGTTRQSKCFVRPPSSRMYGKRTPTGSPLFRSLTREACRVNRKESNDVGVRRGSGEIGGGEGTRPMWMMCRPGRILQRGDRIHRRRRLRFVRFRNVGIFPSRPLSRPRV